MCATRNGAGCAATCASPVRWAASVAGGNGSFTVNGSHTYPRAGAFTVRVTVLEDGQRDHPVTFDLDVTGPAEREQPVS